MDEYLFWGEFASQQLNAKVLVPDYRLAPEHPYPAACDDCEGVVRTNFVIGKLYLIGQIINISDIPRDGTLSGFG